MVSSVLPAYSAETAEPPHMDMQFSRTIIYGLTNLHAVLKSIIYGLANLHAVLQDTLSAA